MFGSISCLAIDLYLSISSFRLSNLDFTLDLLAPLNFETFLPLTIPFLKVPYGESTVYMEMFSVSSALISAEGVSRTSILLLGTSLNVYIES
jgi:hypothetical protein